MSAQPDCPLCPSNGLLSVPILVETDGAYLTRSPSSPANFNIIPKDHIEEPTELPDTWWAELKQLLPKVPELGDHYNMSLNVGQHAGQSVKHLHFWVIPRESGKPSSGKGFARLIHDADKK